MYITDNWKSYAEIIPQNLLLQTKKETHSIERNNFRQRHWFARFRRKTCVVSRSLQAGETYRAEITFTVSKNGISETRYAITYETSIY